MPFPPDSLMTADVLTLLENIARRRLFVATLQERHSDRLDFYDVGVTSLRDALFEAYLLGARSGLQPSMALPSD